MVNIFLDIPSILSGNKTPMNAREYSLNVKTPPPTEAGHCPAENPLPIPGV